ncbi:MAG: hypothetical protein AB7Q81_16035 [Gammaproteobacteria bacterium]
MTSRLVLYRCRVCTIGFAVLVFGALSAQAAIVLDPATFNQLVSVGGNSTVQTAPGTILVNEFPGYPRGTGTATSTATDVVPLLTEARVALLGADSPAAYGGTASARINFEFALQAGGGGTPGSLVPVNITTAGLVGLDITAGAAGSASGTASAILQIPGVITLRADRSCSGGFGLVMNCSSNDGESFGGTFAAMLQEGRTYTAELNVSVHGQGGGLGFLTVAHAMVDPTITVVAPFAGDYQVVFSPGISLVPVPAALPLLVGGLVVLRRRLTAPAHGQGARPRD